MLSLQVIRDFVYEHFPKVTTSKGGTHFHARCILCGDSKKTPHKKRFHLDWNNGEPGYHCFNCDRSGSFLQLYAQIKCMNIDEAKKELYSYDPERIKKSLTKTNGIIKKETKVTHMDYITEDCINVVDPVKGIIEPQYQKLLSEFIDKRKIPNDIKHTIYVAVKGRYKGRAIIPVYKDGHIIYFQGRALVDIEPKYLNPIVEKESVVYNEENFERNLYIIVTEGLLDAFMIGKQGTSCLGASLSEEFYKKVEKMTDRGIIIVLDNDETGKEKLLGLLEETFANNAKFFIMPHKYKEIKDLNQLVTEYGIEDVYDFVVSNSHNKFTTKIRLGIMEAK